MGSPQDRDRDGFDDRTGEGSDWQEPGHLGQGGTDPDDAVPEPRPEPSEATWEPPGWSLPPAQQPAAGRPAAEQVQPDPPPLGARKRDLGGHDRTGSGLGRGRARGAVDEVFANQGDAVGAQGWALEHGWVASDGTGPRDAVLAELVASAPVRLTKDHRAAGVLRGRAGPLELVAFDVLYASGRFAVPEYAITAAPVLATVPGLRLSPARLWKHRTGGLLHIPGDDAEFDGRWVLLAAEDGPAVRRLVTDPTVRALLLGSDDGDEFWSTGGGVGGAIGGGVGGATSSHVAAIRPDGHRPQLIEHHARLLAAIVGALAVGS